VTPRRAGYGTPVAYGSSENDLRLDRTYVRLRIPKTGKKSIKTGHSSPRNVVNRSRVYERRRAVEKGIYALLSDRKVTVAMKLS